MILSLAFWGLLTGEVLGLGALVLPARWRGRFSRRRIVLGLVAAVAIQSVLLLLPASESRIPEPTTALDEVSPRWQFREVHRITIDAAPEEVYAAVKGTTAREIPLFLALTALRRFGRPGPESVLNAPEDRPLLDVATATGFRWLADEPGREVVVGTLVVAPDGVRLPDTIRGYQQLDEVAGVAKASMNFLLIPRGGQTELITETRVFATNPSSRRAFGAYWRVIYPGSALIRVMWLRAIRARAEGG